MNQSEKPARPRSATPEPHLTLRMEDDRAFKERGYDPYATVVRVKDARVHDVWRNKPKRA
jgi:hypothetical protein